MVALTLVMLPSIIAAQTVQPGRSSFDDGVAAYRDGRFEAALKHFRIARDAGYATPRLQFNLALTHYRLRQYDRAESLFRELLYVPDFEPMAAYHLGLIAERRGDESQAGSHYRRAGSLAPDDRLRRLADAGLTRVRGVRETNIYLFAGGGYDSNPALLDDPSRFDSGDDAYFESFGSIAHRRNAWLVDAGFFLRQHASENDVDTFVLRAAAGRHSEFGAWRLRSRGEVAAMRFDGERLQEEYSALFDWRRQHGGRVSELRAHLARIEATEPFDFLTGWRYRGEARLSGAWRGNWLRLGYQLEHNDRRDLERNGEFFSQSPLRHRLRLDTYRRLNTAWSVESRIEYRYSRYSDENRFAADDDSIIEERRTESRVTLRGGARWHFRPRWSVLGEYQYTHNSASIDAFDYDRHTVLFGLEWIP